MNRQWRKVLAAALTVSLSVTALSACSKKDEDTGIDKEAAYITLGSGETMSAGTANLILRYQQSVMENGFGSFIKAYYGDIWTADLTGTGEAYGDTFKEQMVHEMTHMLLAEAHMEDLGISLTDEEEQAIEEAAKQFISDNADYADALDKMSADEDTVKDMLRYYTIQSKAEAAVTADVDTEVSDEEAAQRTVNYIYFTATEETEEETEEISEAVTEGGESVAEMASSEAFAEAETDVKTSSAEEAGTEEADESVAEAAEGAEAATEAETEETETESAEMIAARAAALEKAEAFLAEAQNMEDADTFAEAADAAVEADSTAYADSYTFGADDTWPDAAIIEATTGLDDNTLVDHVIVVDTNYYVVYVADAFDEDATEEEKLNIVEERRNEAIETQFEAWEEEAEIDVNGDISSQLLFDFALTEETESEEDIYEAETDAEYVTESYSEGAEDLSESTAELVG